MSLLTIKPAEARRLVDSGAILIDVREADEHTREKIPGARHVPLSKLDEADLAVHQGKPVIKNGARTRLVGKFGDTCEAFIVGGGLDAWRKASLPVESDRHQPLELQRQVLIGAGSLAVVDMLLGLFVSPWFFAVQAFVGSHVRTCSCCPPQRLALLT